MQVASRDGETGENVTAEVTHAIARTGPAILRLTLRDLDSGETEVLRTTPEHPFHVENWAGLPEAPQLVAAGSETTNDPALAFPTDGATLRGTWVRAGALQPGHLVSDRDGGTAIEVVSIERDAIPVRVYNIEVEGTHSYFAGSEEAWVHNVHKNSYNSPALTCLYKLYKTIDLKIYKPTIFLKWGITSQEDSAARYPGRKDLKVDCKRFGSRRDMAKLERRLCRRFPGPWNREPWAGPKPWPMKILEKIIN